MKFRIEGEIEAKDLAQAQRLIAGHFAALLSGISSEENIRLVDVGTSDLTGLAAWECGGLVETR